MANEIQNGCPAALIPDALWHKSSFSGNLGNCVEVAALANGEFAVRNSRFPDGPALVFTPAEWAAFSAGMDNGEFTGA